MNDRRPTLLEYALLGLANNQPRTGYAFRKVFEATPMAHYSSSPGSIYPALQRLDERGLLESSVGDGDTLRPKRVYTVTSEGVEALRAWVSQRVTREDVIWRPRELMLRFSFMGGLVDDDVSCTFLEQLAVELDGYARSLEEYRSAMPGHGPPHGVLAMEAGLANVRSMKTWAKNALRQFLPSQRSDGRG